MRFSVGDAVRTLPVRRGGHTRLPGYLSERTGYVVAIAGPYAFSDERALGGEFSREPVYAVRFDAGELWQTPGANQSVVADLFESYLEHV